ncbi:unnamed protein product [Brachionus calyciflorus]|uniref:Uncharacterized protein n=1 Tax=Brachionus calyciflorus TaxID=104777 RepID=A0A813VPJ1_9BILA|nr:unnamed protein product [Brachionus calyciflorus]
MSCHLNKPEDKEKLSSKQKLKEIAICNNEPPRTIIREFQTGLSEECFCLLGKKDSIRRQIIRTRNAEHVNKVSKSLSDLEITEELTTTFKGVKFHFGDSGKNDTNRVIFFTTEQNLESYGLIMTGIEMERKLVVSQGVKNELMKCIQGMVYACNEEEYELYYNLEISSEYCLDEDNTLVDQSDFVFSPEIKVN